MRFVLTLLLLGLFTPAIAQEDSASTIPPADSADVHSLDAIMLAVYDVISGPGDQARDWDRFRSLFAPGARLIPTGRRRDGQGVVAQVMTVDDYAERAANFFSNPGGFYEKEIARRAEVYGNIAHVFSTYASFREGEDEPFMRGINSFQLLKDNNRWWVVTIFWDAEREGNPIPATYLPQ